MKILIDLQTLQSESRNRGIGKYTKGLIPALLQRESQIEWHLLFNLAMPAQDLPHFNLPRHRVHYYQSLSPTRGNDGRNIARSRVSETIRDAFIGSQSFDLVHIASPFDGFGDETIASWSNLNGTKLGATVYDLIPFEEPDVYLSDQTALDWYNHRRDGLKKADVVLAISEYTKRVSADRLGIAGEQIFNIGADVDPIFSPLNASEDQTNSILNQYGILQKFIIHTGILEERKNIGVLIKAFGMLPEEIQRKHQIVLAGETTEDQRQQALRCAANCGVGPSKIVFTGFVPDSHLALLYSLARVAVMPSLAEGFGLPLLEAMRCRCPVLGSNVTSIPEVIGHSDLLFSPRDPSDFAEKLKNILIDPSFRRFAIEHVMTQQAKFSWRHSAQVAEEAFTRAIENRAGDLDVTPPKGTYLVAWPAGLDQAGKKILQEFSDVISRTGEVVVIGEDSLASELIAHSGAIPIVASPAIAKELHRLLSRTPTIVLLLPGPSEAPPPTLAECYWFSGWAGVKHAGSQFQRGFPEDAIGCKSSVVGIVRPEPRGRPSTSWQIRRPGLDNSWAASSDIADDVAKLWRNSQLSYLIGCIFQLKKLAYFTDLSEGDRRSLSKAVASNHPLTAARRLFVDITELVNHDGKSGIQRVVRNILREIIESSGSFRVEPVYRADSSYRYARKFTSRFIGIEVNIADAVVEFQPGDVFLGLDLDLLTSAVAMSALRTAHLRGMQVCYVVYDVLPLIRPDWFLDGMSDMFLKWLSAIATFSDKLICISKATAESVTQQLQSRSLRINENLEVLSFYLGSDLEKDIGAGIEELSSQFIAQFGQRPIFTSVATLEPRKGHWQLLGAFELLWSQGHDVILVFVGRRGWHTASLIERIEKHSELNRRLFWLEGIADSELDDVYRRSTAIILASEGEGFGLPLVEAARHSKPIIARDLPVFREVAGEGAFYFHGLEGADLARAISDWMILFREGKVPQSTCIEIKSWSESTRRLLHTVDAELAIEK
jgi:glycosyltransferase involved in cell wall biosynthesis